MTRDPDVPRCTCSAPTYDNQSHDPLCPRVTGIDVDDDLRARVETLEIIVEGLVEDLANFAARVEQAVAAVLREVKSREEVK